MASRLLTRAAYRSAASGWRVWSSLSSVTGGLDSSPRASKYAETTITAWAAASRRVLTNRVSPPRRAATPRTVSSV
nr:hypothetical protein [Nonomuraea harbinensis]